jgi:hypothetical protein
MTNSTETPAVESNEAPAVESTETPAVESKTAKAGKPAGLGELKGFDLSGAVIERRVVRDGGSLELRVVLPAPAE